MSKLFFDHLIVFDEIELIIKKNTQTVEEKEELWELIDEMVHHKVLEVILDRLPRGSHEEFLELFHQRPHDETTIIGYLKRKINENVEEILKQELGSFAFDLLEEIKAGKMKR